MRGKVYTSYIANIKHIPEGVKKILITRIIPQGLNLISHNLVCFQELSPLKQTLKEYKNKKLTFEEFESKFRKQINNSDMALMTLEIIESYLDEGNDICIICYEKDMKVCHRSIEGRYYLSLGYEWAEIIKGGGMINQEAYTQFSPAHALAYTKMTELAVLLKETM